MAKSVPDGFNTLSPHIVVQDALKALEFYKKAFGAQEVMRMEAPGGKIGHAEIKIGDSVIMLADEFAGSGSRSPQSLGGTTAGIFLYVENVDQIFNQATAAGAQVESPLANMFWGDRYGKLKDPFGHSWSIATHVEDVAPAEMEKRMKEAMAKTPEHAKSAH